METLPREDGEIMKGEEILPKNRLEDLKSGSVLKPHKDTKPTRRKQVLGQSTYSTIDLVPELAKFKTSPPLMTSYKKHYRPFMGRACPRCSQHRGVAVPQRYSRDGNLQCQFTTQERVRHDPDEIRD
ncbi:hypothetical protein BSL78_19066 [Apostichopus japonicus]|uniref:Uncharacterized protein n=1 Tax=Stichopus japonicus TaxID=307972 RepID=A0A2G8K7U9_STIJA|nr:hypothetical protein BSL78_19066 [Apostichopus japonicus]